MGKRSATPGGNRLRALRESVGKPQLEVELDANLGIGYLGRLESGKVRRPERETLERILSALGARYSDRRELLELFGYLVDTPLPDEADIAWAIGLCRAELKALVFPAYLLDCAHRLLAWNDLLPHLLAGVNVAGLHRESILRALFDPAKGLTPLISNGSEFFPAQIRALRYQMRAFHGEIWYAALIDELLKALPLFRDYWLNVPIMPAQDGIAARPLVPLEIRRRDGATFRFRLSAEPFAQDRRFRLIYYIPADAATIQACALWFDSGVGSY